MMSTVSLLLTLSLTLRFSDAFIVKSEQFVFIVILQDVKYAKIRALFWKK